MRTMISTRGRYALRVLVDIAEHGNGHFVKLDEIACLFYISDAADERTSLKLGGRRLINK